MLAGVSMALAPRFETVSVLARRPGRMARLAERVEGAGHVNPLAVDYHDSRRLTAALAGAVSAFGPFAIAVVWIHSTAPEAPRIVGRFVEGPYVHVLSSGRANLRELRARWDFMPVADVARYQTVWLGFVIEDDGEARWLTDDEIVNGVLQAIVSGARSSTVGTIEPRASQP